MEQEGAPGTRAGCRPGATFRAMGDAEHCGAPRGGWEGAEQCIVAVRRRVEFTSRDGGSVYAHRLDMDGGTLVWSYSHCDRDGVLAGKTRSVRELAHRGPIACSAAGPDGWSTISGARFGAALPPEARGELEECWVLGDGGDKAAADGGDGGL
eukprot:gene44763-55747_t